MADPVDPELAQRLRNGGNPPNGSPLGYATVGDLRAAADVVDREHTAETRLRQLLDAIGDPDGLRCAEHTCSCPASFEMLRCIAAAVESTETVPLNPSNIGNRGSEALRGPEADALAAIVGDLWDNPPGAGAGCGPTDPAGYALWLHERYGIDVAKVWDRLESTTGYEVDGDRWTLAAAVEPLPDDRVQTGAYTARPSVVEATHDSGPIVLDMLPHGEAVAALRAEGYDVSDEDDSAEVAAVEPVVPTPQPVHTLSLANIERGFPEWRLNCHHAVVGTRWEAVDESGEPDPAFAGRCVLLDWWDESGIDMVDIRQPLTELPVAVDAKWYGDGWEILVAALSPQSDPDTCPRCWSDDRALRGEVMGEYAQSGVDSTNPCTDPWHSGVSPKEANSDDN